MISNTYDYWIIEHFDEKNFSWNRVKEGRLIQRGVRQDTFQPYESVNSPMWWIDLWKDNCKKKGVEFPKQNYRIKWQKIKQTIVHDMLEETHITFVE